MFGYVLGRLTLSLLEKSLSLKAERLSKLLTQERCGSKIIVKSQRSPQVLPDPAGFLQVFLHFSSKEV